MTFCNFCIFRKIDNSSLFSKAIREGKLSTEVHTFSSKTLQVAKVAPLELFSLQNDTSRTFIDVSDVFWCSGSPKTRLGAQNAFWSNKCTLGPKDRAPGSSCIRVNGRATKIGELLAPKCPLGALGALWVPLGPRAGWLAGWLAAEGSELRAEGSELRAQS